MTEQESSLRVLVTREPPGDAISTLSERPDLEVTVWRGQDPPPYAYLREQAPSLDGLLCLLTDRIDAALLESATRLRVVSQMAVGVDNIDVEAATRLGIPVGHTPGVLTQATADLTWALILAALRRLPEAERFLREQKWRYWSPGLLLGRDVCGTTLGIVGMGAIGAAVANRAQGFDMRVVYASRTDKSVPGAERFALDQLLKEADVVSIHTALNAETRNMIGQREIALMKPTACLVNTSRGGIVNEDALVEALAAGRIACAGLDVYAEEPLSADSPLLGVKNVVLLPHIGSATEGTRAKMAARAIENLLAGLRGEPLPFSVNRAFPPRALRSS